MQPYYCQKVELGPGNSTAKLGTKPEEIKPKQTLTPDQEQGIAGATAQQYAEHRDCDTVPLDGMCCHSAMLAQMSLQGNKGVSAARGR